MKPRKRTAKVIFQQRRKFALKGIIFKTLNLMIYAITHLPITHREWDLLQEIIAKLETIKRNFDMSTEELKP